MTAVLTEAISAESEVVREIGSDYEIKHGFHVPARPRNREVSRRSLAMRPSVAAKTWHYRLITVSGDEDHHDLTTGSALRRSHEFMVEHRGKVERVRVEAIEPSDISGVDARVTARIIDRRPESTDPGPVEAIFATRLDAEIDVEIRV